MIVANIKIKLEVNSPMNFGAKEVIELYLDDRIPSWVISKQSPKNKGKRPILKTLLSTDVEEVLNNFGQAKLSPLPTFLSGKDGATFNLEIFQGYYSVRYRWWTITPDGYEPVGDLVKQLYEWSNNDTD